jgi:hypothetical protein
VVQGLLLACCCSMLGGCLTCDLWEARDNRTLVPPSEDKHGHQTPKVEVAFVNNAVGLLLTPFTLIFDIIAFPVQLIGGYRPYGDNRY